MKAKASAAKTHVKTSEYDLLLIIKPNLSEDEYNKQTDKIKEWITKNQGEITFSNIIGSRELAQPLDKFTKGYYVHLQFIGTPKTVETFTQNVKVTEVIFRHLLVSMDSIKSKKKPVEAEA